MFKRNFPLMTAVNPELENMTLGFMFHWLKKSTNDLLLWYKNIPNQGNSFKTYLNLKYSPSVLILTLTL